MKNKLFKKKCQTGTVLPPKGAYENRQYFGLPDTMTRDEFSQLTPQQIQDSIKAFNAKQMEGVKGVVGDTISRQPYNFQKETTQYSQIPVAKQTFQEAYAAAKNQGLSQFMFEGRPIAVKDDPNFRSPSQQLQPEYKTIQTSNVTTIPFKPENVRNQTGGDQSQQIMQVVMQALQQGKQPQEILQALVQSGMDEAQATQIIQQVMQQGQQQSQTGDLASRMGFRFDSPYQYNKSLNINTPNGLIDMSATGIPLYAQGNNGMSKFLPPYSGIHDFGNATQVVETNLAFNGTQKKPAGAGTDKGNKRFAQMGGEMQEAQTQPQQEQGGDQMAQIQEMIVQALQQGKQPEEIMQALVEAGVPQEQAQQMIQQVMSQMQGQQQQPQDSGALQMQPGGIKLGNRINNDLNMQASNNIQAPTPEQAMVMSEQEALQPSMMISEATPVDPYNTPTARPKWNSQGMYIDMFTQPSLTTHEYSHAKPSLDYDKVLNQANAAEVKEVKGVVKEAKKVVQGSNFVTELQTNLKANGYDPGTVDGVYGAKTTEALAAFQRDHKDLVGTIDGVAGSKTLKALGLDGIPSLQKNMTSGALLKSARIKSGATSIPTPETTQSSTSNIPYNYEIPKVKDLKISSEENAIKKEAQIPVTKPITGDWRSAYYLNEYPTTPIKATPKKVVDVDSELNKYRSELDKVSGGVRRTSTGNTYNDRYYKIVKYLKDKGVDGVIATKIATKYLK